MSTLSDHAVSSDTRLPLSTGTRPFDAMTLEKAARINATMAGALVRYRFSRSQDQYGTFHGVAWKGLPSNLQPMSGVGEMRHGDVVFSHCAVGGGGIWSVGSAQFVEDLEVLFGDRARCERCQHYEARALLVETDHEGCMVHAGDCSATGFLGIDTSVIDWDALVPMVPDEKFLLLDMAKVSLGAEILASELASYMQMPADTTEAALREAERRGFVAYLGQSGHSSLWMPLWRRREVTGNA